MDISHWVSLPSAEQYAADVFAPQQSIGLFTPLPDDGMNPGRAMRCRMMSLLC